MQDEAGTETEARTWILIVKLKEAILADRKKNWKEVNSSLMMRVSLKLLVRKI